MDKKTFTYQFNIDAVPYDSDTAAEYYFGTGATYNPDYSEDMYSRGIAFDMIKDALSHVLLMKMKFLSKNKIQDTEILEGQNKLYWEYLDRKEKNYLQIESSLVGKRG